MTARKAALSVVKTGAESAEPKPRVKPKSLADAIEGDDYLEVLIAQRREMVRDVKDEKGPAKAAMHRLIAMLSKEITALQVAAAEEEAESVDVADEAFDAEAL